MKTKVDIKKALDVLEGMSKGDQGTNSPLNSAEGDDMGVNRGKPMSDEAKKKKEDEKGKGKESKKSFSAALPDEVEDQIEVSEFLKSLVDYTGEKVDALSDHLAKSEVAQIEANELLKSELDGLKKSQAMVGLVLKSICEKMGIIENQPARRPKTDMSVSKSQVADRSFETVDGNPVTTPKATTIFKSLSSNPQIAKSQMSETLCNLVKSGNAREEDVIQFEMNGYVRPELISYLKEKLN